MNFNNFENRLRFDKVSTMSLVVQFFLEHSVDSLGYIPAAESLVYIFNHFYAARPESYQIC